MRNLQEERLVLICGDKRDGLFGDKFGVAARLLATRDPGRLGVALKLEGSLPALLPGTEAGTTEVPFAKVAGFVADRPESFGERLDFERELPWQNGIDQTCVGAAMTGDVLRDAEAGLVLAALKIGAGG